MTRYTEFDSTDHQIVAELQKNARLSNKELSHRVGVAASTCLERVRRLIRTGVLRGFHADVDPKALGVGLQAMLMVKLSVHEHGQIEAFREHVLALSEVSVLYHVAGNNDFLVHVAVRDSNHLRDLVMKSFTTLAEVAHIETSLVFEFTRKPVSTLTQTS